MLEGALPGAVLMLEFSNYHYVAPSFQTGIGYLRYYILKKYKVTEYNLWEITIHLN